MHKLPAIPCIRTLLFSLISLLLLLLLMSFFFNHRSLALAQDNRLTQMHASYRQDTVQNSLEVAQQKISIPSSFLGTWHVHTTVLTINKDGTATYIARAYENCAEGKGQPCDTWQGDLIIPGVQENIKLTAVQNSTLKGYITSSTDKTTGQSITITQEPDNMVGYKNLFLCGPNTPSTVLCGA